MKKLFLGILIGAAITSVVFYFINKNEQRENAEALLELLKLEQAKEKQTTATLNDPGSTLSASALTIVMASNNELLYFRGDCSKIEKTDLVSVKEILATEKKRSRPQDLMIIIKDQEGASFKNSIDLLDAITTAGIPAGHFAQIDLSEKEKYCIQNYKQH